MSSAAQAVELFRQGCCCSQAVLAAYAKSLGMDEGNALKVATGFCAGIGGTADTCGAVTGAIMVIGLKHASPIRGDRRQRPQTLAAVREFLREFKARNGSIICRDLLQYDISTPEGDTSARELGLFKTICPKIVESAGQILDTMLTQPAKAAT